MQGSEDGQKKDSTPAIRARVSRTLLLFPVICAPRPTTIASISAKEQRTRGHTHIIGLARRRGRAGFVVVRVDVLRRLLRGVVGGLGVVMRVRDRWGREGSPLGVISAARGAGRRGGVVAVVVGGVRLMGGEGA